MSFLKYTMLFVALFVTACKSHGQSCCVTATPISQDRFLEAFSHFDCENQVLDTTITIAQKNIIISKVKELLSKEELEWLEDGDLEIPIIGKYSLTGDYLAIIWWASEQQAYMLNSSFKVNKERIVGSVDACYSKKGLFAGQSSFDCDDYLLITFYRREHDGSLKRFAEYSDRNKMLDNFNNNLNPSMFWKDESLYCRCVNRENPYSNEVCYIILQLGCD